MEGDGVVYRDENGADIDAPREWMAPDWVASQGETSVEGSPWENAALFDFQWGALPAWEVFNP